MITSENKKVIRQKTINTSFGNTLKDTNRYNQVMRRATLTGSKVSSVMKEYIDIGIANDKFLQLFNQAK